MFLFIYFVFIYLIHTDILVVCSILSTMYIFCCYCYYIGLQLLNVFGINFFKAVFSCSTLRSRYLPKLSYWYIPSLYFAHQTACMARLIYRRPEQVSFILYYTALTGLSFFDLQWPCSCPRVCRCLPVWSLTSLRGGYRIHSHRATQDCGCTSLVKQEEHLSWQKTSGLIKKLYAYHHSPL